jgi:acyl-CoA reductase-like NAD-dependent aldehyde dehydrogenase
MTLIVSHNPARSDEILTKTPGVGRHGVVAALARANSVAHGLVSSVHTADLDTVLRCADRLATGMVKVNAPTTGVDFHLPFGGEKASGHGPREQGKAALDFYTRTRTVTMPSAA